jgi:pimeloyl-ACP methyl ester carboxylesterase
VARSRADDASRMRPVAPVPPEPRRERPAGRGGRRDLVTRLGRDLRALASPAGVRGAVVETAWISAHLAMYPLGVLRERQREVERYGLGGLRPGQRGLLEHDVEAAGTPIVLVHGMLDNRAIFAVLGRRLRSVGFNRVSTINYSPMTSDIRAAARRLSAEVEALVACTGYERVHVVGHSLGGLIARYYVQRLGGDARVHTLVTMGTPHQGSLSAHLLPGRLAGQLRPGSDLFAELGEPAAGCRTRFVVYYSDLDQVIVPHANARLDHPDLSAVNVRLHGVGHLSLPIHPPTLREISHLLSHLDADGSTRSAGLGRLPSAGEA